MKYCRECGAEIMEKAVVCPKCGCATGYKESNSFNLGVKENEEGEKVYNKLIALLLWFFTGAIGGHRFYVGDINGGVGMLLCLIFSWLIVPGCVLIIILIIDLINILADDKLANRKISW